MEGERADGPQLTEHPRRDELRQKAKQQALDIPQSNSAGSPDLWTYEVLNHLPVEAVEEIRQLLRDMERQAEVPVQFTLHTVCLLAKSSTAERPISLTHVFWRQYCRARWSLLETWIQEYRLQAPCDSATGVF